MVTDSAHGGPRGWFSNPAARSYRASPARETLGQVRRFHESVPGYARRRLVELTDLADRWRVGRVYVKEESARFGLPAFKALGASWAVARILAERAGLGPTPAYDDVVAAAAADPVCLVTATDGNHGRAVAHFATLFGLSSIVVVPEFVGSSAAEAIVGEGAVVERVGTSYDEAVARAISVADASPGRVLVQDMSWPGYETVPGWIVDGYGTMLMEATEQLSSEGHGHPDLVAVPVGVGSLALAVVSYYRGIEPPARTAILSCEPATADCLLASLRAGEPTMVDTGRTVMAGLNCGTVSAAAWPVLHAGLDAAVTVHDEEALRALDDLTAGGVEAGASGAAGPAGVEAVLTGPEAPRRRESLGLDADSVVLLLSTEGRQGAGGQTSAVGR